ncbi:hypothetical protein [Streptomyces sp. NPDC048650]|uniref:hypothetical protein n=1 Tax=unclassified Streptomyces TaxID=2593676 RepID=UPI0037183D36
MADDQSKQVDESEFLEITKDPAAARVMRKSLEQIAQGCAGGVLKEMAHEVLSGRVGLREAVNIPAYSDQMVERFQDFKKDWDSISEKDRDRLVDAGEKFIEEQRKEIDEAERGSRETPTRSTKARHDGGSWSMY